MRLASTLIFLLVIASLPLASSTSGRSIEVDISIMKYDWLSNETVEFSIEVSNAPFNQQFIAEYSISNLQENVINTDSVVFQSSGPSTQIPIFVKHFFDSSNFYFFTVSIIDSTGVIIATGEVSFMVFQNTIMPQIGNLLAFGDSLSDMGNAKDSILNVPDVPPYWQGRFSNGPVWLEYVSQAYGVTTTVGSLTEQGDNRAFGGSQTGQGFSYLLLPNVGTQISNYLANVQSSIAQNDVVSLCAGGNDFLY